MVGARVVRGVVLASAIATAVAAAADPVSDCGDPRLAHRAHNRVRLVSTPAGATVRIQWNMRIAGHEECGTVVTPWEGSLPVGGYNLIVSLDGKDDQIGLALGGRRRKVTVKDVTPRAR